MNAYLVFFLCSVVGSTVGYYAPREAPYNTGPNDPYSVAVDPNFLQQPSQRLFWGNQGTNQVGGTGWWASLTNKFPILGTMFGRMELPPQYGAPNQYEVATQYGAPNQYEVATQYGAPQRIQPQPQFYQAPPVYQQYRQQYPQQFAQRFVPFGRDVGLTDDAVIITPPQVPINPQPAPVPIPAPAPAPEPETGYQYNKPQYRLELPHK